MALAIRKLGGVTKCVQLTGYSDASWNRWRRIGYVSMTAKAIRVSELTGIPISRLAGPR